MVISLSTKEEPLAFDELDNFLLLRHPVATVLTYLQVEEYS